jgi:hypothetical protein
MATKAALIMAARKGFMVYDALPILSQALRSNVAIAATRKRDAAPFGGEPLNCPLTVMVTVSAKLTFDRFDPDLEPDSARMEPCGAKSREVISPWRRLLGYPEIRPSTKR